MDLFEYDPVTGITEYFDMDPMTGAVSIRSEENVQPLLDLNLSMRNEGIKHVKGSPIRHYATVPATVIMDMLNKGINFYKREDFPRVISEIETNYPKLKVDTMRHSVK